MKGDFMIVLITRNYWMRLIMKRRIMQNEEGGMHNIHITQPHPRVASPNNC